MKGFKNFMLVIFMSIAFVGFAQDTPTVEEEIKTELNENKTTIDAQVEISPVAESNEVVIPPIDDNVFGDIPGKITDLVSSLEWYDFLFILLFNLLGYLSPFIPVLRKIGDTEVRIGVGAIVLIMIFATMDINAAWKLVVEFFLSTKLYELVFKRIKSTPTPAAPSVALGKE